MFTINDIAAEIGLQPNTLRYWLKKNNIDYNRNFYDFNLWDLIKKINIVSKRHNAKEHKRSYPQYIILDMEEFKTEFNKYVNYIENIKQKKRVGNLYWTNSAIDCYCAKMTCNNCFNQKICYSVCEFNSEPPMKNVVRKLLEQIGKPPI